MEQDLLYALIPMVGMFITCIAHIVIIRVPASLTHTLVFSIMLGAACCALLLHYNDATCSLFIMAIMSYFALCFCYWATINLNRTALRVRVLKELLQAPQQRIQKEYLSRLYDAEEIFNRRLERMVSGGHLHREGERVRIGKRQLLYIAWIIDRLRVYINA